MTDKINKELHLSESMQNLKEKIRKHKLMRWKRIITAAFLGFMIIFGSYLLLEYRTYENTRVIRTYKGDSSADGSYKMFGDSVLKYTKDGMTLIDQKGKEIWNHLKDILDTMNDAVSRGIKKDGVLPGKLRYPRKAKEIYDKIDKKKNYLVITKKIFAYALAVSEENSSAGTIVTAPTCGAAGVIPGLLRALIEEYELDETTSLRALAVAGLIGNLIKENATISGAEAGCQAEIGSACSMAAGMAVYILGGTIDQIEYAAEMGMEHHLGMTCDPVGGYVQIPCIERNAIVAVRALNTADYALSTNGEHTISFDQVVITMKETGSDMCSSYKETSTGGLAKYYDKFLKD